MQVGIPVAYNVCEVKLDKINHWICVHREDFPVAMVYCVLIYHRNWKIFLVYTYPVVYFIKFYYTYIVSNWDPNVHYMS